MENSTNIPWDASGQLEVLTFNLQEDVFAVEATLVQEILDLLPETVVPGARRLVGSVVNFRGKVIPIADLRLAFRLPAGEATVDSRIIVIQLELGGEPALIGIKTDKVNEVTTLDRNSSEDPPVLGMRWRRDFIRSLIRRNDSVIVLPDVVTIFSATDEASSAPHHLQAL